MSLKMWKVGVFVGECKIEEIEVISFTEKTYTYEYLKYGKKLSKRRESRISSYSGAVFESRELAIDWIKERMTEQIDFLECRIKDDRDRIIKLRNSLECAK